MLGEVVLSTVLAVQGALGGDYLAGLVPLVLGALLIVFSTWWLYFRRDHAALFAAGRIEAVMSVGYGHLLLFGSIAATGAGLAVAVDVVTHHAHTTAAAAAWSVTVPFAVFLTTLGLLDAATEAARWMVVETVVLLVAVVAVDRGVGRGRPPGRGRGPAARPGRRRRRRPAPRRRRPRLRLSASTGRPAGLMT